MSEIAVNPTETPKEAIETLPQAHETPQPPQETATAQVETETAPQKTQWPPQKAAASKAEKPLSDWAKRFVITKNLPGKRGAMVKAVIEAGMKEGYWKDGSHFMDKVLDFAINSQAANKALGITKGFQFGIPDNVPTSFFANGYYTQFPSLKNTETI